jgi:hypothetical protein
MLVHLGQSEAARGLAQQIRHTPSIPAGRRIYSFIYESLIEPGPHNLALILEAEALNPKRNPLSAPSLNVVKMLCLPPPEALELGQEIIAEALRYEAEHLMLTAETRSAQALLALGRSQEALQMSQAAMQRLETRTPVLAHSGEVMFTHHRALETVSHADMHSHLDRSLAWVMNINDQHVPTGYREGFLNGNHWNRLILEAANQHGLTHK